MASALYPLGKVKLWNGTLSLATAAGYYIALVTSSYVYNAAHEFFSEIIADGNEVVGTAYVADGMELPSNAVTLSGANAKFDGGDCVWATSTITARAAILYRYRGGAHTADDLVAYIDFGADKVTSGVDFKIQWHSDGILVNA